MSKFFRKLFGIKRYLVCYTTPDAPEYVKHFHHILPKSDAQYVADLLAIRRLGRGEQFWIEEIKE